MTAKVQPALDEPFLEIPLSQGLVALVSVEDYARLSRFHWHAARMGGKFYARRSDGAGKYVSMHHDVLGFPPAGQVVDHRNGIGVDNRRSNLRYATVAQNNANRSGARRYRGVFRSGRRFMARISADNRNYYGGLFGCAEQAACAADALMRQHHGEFARLNNVTAANDA